MENEFNINIGSIVCLNHGGPLMTVIRLYERTANISDDQHKDKTTFLDARCVRFDVNGVSHEDWFPAKALRVQKEKTKES